MAFKVLPLSLAAALVVAFDHFIEATLIMGQGVLRYNDLLASMVHTVNPLEAADVLMVLHFSSLQLEGASFFEQALALIRTLDDFQGAGGTQVLVHPPSLDALPAVVSAIDLIVYTGLSNVIIYLNKGQAHPTVHDAVH